MLHYVKGKRRALDDVHQHMHAGPSQSEIEKRRPLKKERNLYACKNGKSAD